MRKFQYFYSFIPYPYSTYTMKDTTPQFYNKELESEYDFCDIMNNIPIMKPDNEISSDDDSGSDSEDEDTLGVRNRVGFFKVNYIIFMFFCYGFCYVDVISTNQKDQYALYCIMGRYDIDHLDKHKCITMCPQLRMILIERQ